jgi:hypothetical protein
MYRCCWCPHHLTGAPPLPPLGSEEHAFFALPIAVWGGGRFVCVHSHWIDSWFFFPISTLDLSKVFFRAMVYSPVEMCFIFGLCVLPFSALPGLDLSESTLHYGFDLCWMFLMNAAASSKPFLASMFFRFFLQELARMLCLYVEFARWWKKKITQQLDLGVLDARTWSIVIWCHCLYLCILTVSYVFYTMGCTQTWSVIFSFLSFFHYNESSSSSNGPLGVPCCLLLVAIGSLALAATSHRMPP